MDILLPAIHMLMLRLPWSWAAATEDSQAHTSCRLAPAPGCEGAGVVEVAMLATRAALQLSRSRSCGVMAEIVQEMGGGALYSQAQVASGLQPRYLVLKHFFVGSDGW